jgi:hypothetical protein
MVSHTRFLAVFDRAHCVCAMCCFLKVSGSCFTFNCVFEGMWFQLLFDVEVSGLPNKLQLMLECSNHYRYFTASRLLASRKSLHILSRPCNSTAALSKENETEQLWSVMRGYFGHLCTDFLTGNWWLLLFQIVQTCKTKGTCCIWAQDVRNGAQWSELSVLVVCKDFSKFQKLLLKHIFTSLAYEESSKIIQLDKGRTHDWAVQTSPAKQKEIHVMDYRTCREQFWLHCIPGS